MKKILFTFLFLFAFFAGYSQMYNNGGAVTVETGATLVIEGNYTSSGAATIQVNGNVQLKGDFINNGGTVVSPSTGTLSLNGTVAQNIGGTTPTNFYCALEINNTNGVSLNGANEVLSNALTLTNGKLTLNAFNLNLSNEGVSGADASKYIVTNSTGALKDTVKASPAVTFPVGTATSYTPATLVNNGTADVYSVRVYPDVTNDGTPTGTTIPQIAQVVNRTWVIGEDVAGGSNLDLTLQWNSGDQGGSFNPANCGIGHYTSGAWNPQQGAAASGAGPYTRLRTGNTTLGSFAVGTGLPMSNLYGLNLTAFLSGPYNTSTNLMSTALPTLGTFPLTQPYNVAPWTYAGTESVTTVPANVTDWVLLELRDATSPATATAATRIARMAAFIMSDGTIKNTDGTAVVPFNVTFTNNLYLVIWHRNHIPVISSAGLTDGGDFIYDYNFTDAVSKAYTTGADPLNTMEAGVYGLWTGNTYGDKSVQRSGFGALNDLQDILTDLGGLNAVNNVYSRSDYNFDKNIQRSGFGNLNDLQRILTVLSGANSRVGYVPN